MHNYYFQYDGFNRLTDAQYGSVTPSVGIMSNAYRVSSKYDKHGNILCLSRSGLLLPVAPKSRIIGGEDSGGGSGSGGSSDYYYGVIDDLTLTYIGNRLQSVSDVADVDPVYKDGMHFFDGASLSSEYAYDSNGNMVLDKNKYVTDISYNRLNLPSSISVSTPTGSLLLPLQRKEDYATYDYDACGGKLTSSYAASNNDMSMSFYSTIDYCCNYIYENGVLSKVLLPNGYISIDESNKVRYHYYLKDHQGNIRVVLSQGNAAEQVNHYYPFGALWGLSKNGSFQKYKFGGKELERVAGLDLYDFEARQYDPVLGRFISMDPLCEKYYSVSPYAYCANNPINNIDPDGRDWYRAENGTVTWTDYTSQQQMNDNGLNGTYLGQAHVVFNGSRNERLGIKNGKVGYIDGEGAITASVTLYGSKNADDIHTLTGYTMTSDAEKYGPIDEGLYNANYDAKGKSGSLKSNWVLNNRGEVRMLDGGINPNAPNQISANGEGYKDGIFIHSTNASGYAGGQVSTGCLLFAPQDFKTFNSVMSGVKNFTVQVTRLQTIKVPLPGVTGVVPNIFIQQMIKKRD